MQTIRSRRRTLGMTQASLAQRIGVSQGAVSQWEKGVASPHITILPKLAEALGCSINDLIDHKEGTPQ